MMHSVAPNVSGWVSEYTPGLYSDTQPLRLLCSVQMITHTHTPSWHEAGAAYYLTTNDV